MLPNKVPYKEQKRHWDYQFNHEEKRESHLLEKEAKKIAEEKRRFDNAE